MENSLEGGMDLSMEAQGTASPYPPGQDPLDKIASEGDSEPVQPTIIETNDVQEGAIEETELEAEKPTDVELSAQERIVSAIESGKTSGTITMADGTEISYGPLSEDAETTSPPEMSTEVKEAFNLPEAEPEEDDTTVGRTDPTPSPAQKPAFDPTAIQNPLKSSDGEPEGGVARTSAKGPVGVSSSEKNAGGLLKPSADLVEDSKVDKFEMSGFEAEYEVNGQVHRVHIRDYFDDAESAKATVTGEKYLMPMPNGTFKLAKISGTPTISYNDREKFSIKNGEWERK